ncbi:MAG: exo-alpha-sialidase [bacterium]|nr:exo-alpha-sialidase [bacterium]
MRSRAFALGLTGALALSALVCLGATNVVLAFGPMEWAPAQALNPNAATDDPSSGNDYNPKLATDGSGHWVCVWHSKETLGGTVGTDYDIFVARSEDNGNTWTGPVAIDPLATTDATSDYHPKVETDGNGHWIVFWYTTDPRGGSGTDADLLFSVSDDNGATWSTPAFLNSNATTDGDSDGDYAKALTTDGHGNWMAVWDTSRPGGEGSILEVSYAVSTNGTTWSDAGFVNSTAPNAGDDRGANIATDGNGMWVAIWYSDNLLGTNGVGDETDIHFSRSTDLGETWSPAAALNTTAQTDAYRDVFPHLCADGAGHWTAVWSIKYGKWVSDPGDYDIYVATSTNGMTWTAPALLNTNGAQTGYDWKPIVDTDRNGNWVAVWESRELMSNPPLGSDRDIVYALSTDHGASWSPTAVLNDFAPMPMDFYHDYEPDLVYGGNGFWMTAWYSVYNLNGTIGGDRDILFSTACLPLLNGDHDCDGDVDLVDFASFQACFTTTGPIESGCGLFDLDSDDNVDLGDFIELVSALTGP